MQEIIRQILSKDSISDSDLNILMKNKGLLTQGDLVRLGLAPVVEVKPEVLPVIEIPTLEVVVPKTRGRKKKII